MSERDANQLAADVRAALNDICLDSLEVPLERALFNRKWAETQAVSSLFLRASDGLDELVALVGALQQDNERLRDAFIYQADERTAAEVALATTRQALAEIVSLPDQTEHYHEADVAIAIARRALAAAGGDTEQEPESELSRLHNALGAESMRCERAEGALADLQERYDRLAAVLDPRRTTP